MKKPSGATGIQIPRDKRVHLFYITRMTHTAATYYFWYFSYPKPLAEVGVRLI
jgi:hypothetical protein